VHRGGERVAHPGPRRSLRYDSGCGRAHPFTPAETTPATKNRWKMM
jgi:hypothetical protein